MPIRLSTAVDSCNYELIPRLGSSPGATDEDMVCYPRDCRAVRAASTHLYYEIPALGSLKTLLVLQEMLSGPVLQMD